MWLQPQINTTTEQEIGMTRNKDRGTRWETACVEYLKDNGVLHAERRALAGANDKGDITGLPGVVFEMKATLKIALAEWIGELKTEMVNAGTVVGAVWAKRVGKQSPSEGYIITTPAVFLRLLTEAGYIKSTECSCPNVDITTVSEIPGSRTTKGLDPSCPAGCGEKVINDRTKTEIRAWLDEVEKLVGTRTKEAA